MEASFYDQAIEGFIEPTTQEYTLKPGESQLFNRELSWMDFNERVLEEARRKNNPLYERLNFLGITCSNLDEFFAIRVASLIDLIEAGVKKEDPAGLTPKQQLEMLLEKNQSFMRAQYSTYNRQIIPTLEEQEIHFLKPDQLRQEQKKFLENYFDQKVFPVVSPIAVDVARPFPLISSQAIHLIVVLETKELHPVLMPDWENERDKKEEKSKGKKDKKEPALYPDFAILQIPNNLPRLIPIETAEFSKRRDFILLEDLVRLFADRFFSNRSIQSSSCFRIMRNADFDIDEEETLDLLAEIETHIQQRKRGQVIRLEIEKSMPESTRTMLQSFFRIPDAQVFRIRGPIDLSFVTELSGLYPNPAWHYKPFEGQPSPRFEEEPDPFACIRQGDVLLSHPYESFEPVVRVIRQAAEDPSVLAIKQTLYRVSGQSPIIQALAQAARKGKQVLVLVELKARFDEERNIHWARELERAGCHVLYGIKGLKTHSKITLIVREEEEDIRRYVHIATGNYNDKTAKIYTDIGLWSCSEMLGRDATDFFNMLSGYSIPGNWNAFIPAPRWLRDDFLFRIHRETENALRGEKALIVAKVNSLVDPEIIRALYEASQAGVTIRLIVRGISCLRPGVPGLSDKIEVRSLVGRYLEHSRIFYFYNSGNEDLLIGSADWMPRNLDKRIELVIPVTDENCRYKLFRILSLQLADTERARILEPDGVYHPVDKRGKTMLDSQIAQCQDALAAREERTRLDVGGERYLPLQHSVLMDDGENLNESAGLC